MMTMKEYHASSTLMRLKYRILRVPLAMLLYGPRLIFGFSNRFSGNDATAKERAGTIGTNLAAAAIIVGGSVAIDFVPFILIQLSILLLSGSIGV